MIPNVTEKIFFSINPRTGAQEGQPLLESTRSEIAAAVQRAEEAFPVLADTSDEERAALLRDLAATLDSHRDALIELADRETALGTPRLSGEIDRTVFQLRAFATYIEEGAHRATRRDEAVAGPPPAGRPTLIRTFVPIGPVAVFAAGNFPFAFSVLGGDTAAALAAGNPVVVKAHPAHPRLSLAVFDLVQEVLAANGLPDGVLALVQGPSPEVGMALVAQPGLEAVSFTGSLRAGKALQQAINGHPKRIPFYGELGSLNPVVAFPQALAEGGRDLAAKLCGSITLGAGQFCTSPGVLLVLDGPESREFIDMLADGLRHSKTHPMLTAGIRSGFEQGVTAVVAVQGVRVLVGGPSEQREPAATLVEASVDEFVNNEKLREEVFGPFCLVLATRNTTEMTAALRAIGGSLTATIWAAGADADLARPVITEATRIAGRLLFSGVPTGVSVAVAQQHGGPWPVSTRPDTTSVGMFAIDRFLRPVCLQDPPERKDLLPPGLQSALGGGVGRIPSLTVLEPKR